MSGVIKTNKDVAVFHMSNDGGLTWKAGDVVMVAEDEAHVLPGAAWNILQRLANQGQPTALPPEAPPTTMLRETPRSTLSTRSTSWSIDGCPPVQRKQAPILIALVDLYENRKSLPVPQFELISTLPPDIQNGYHSRMTTMVQRGYCEAQHIINEKSNEPVRYIVPTKLGMKLVEKFRNEMAQYATGLRMPHEDDDNPRPASGPADLNGKHHSTSA